MIVACSENGVIGAKGDLPWHLPGDLKHFMRSTKGHVVIMGRKTFESLDKPLPGRLNVVVSSSLAPRGFVIDSLKEGKIEGYTVVGSLDEAIEVGYAVERVLGTGLIWIAGGGEIYRQAAKIADEVVRTRVHTRIEDGDTFFDELDHQIWGLERSEQYLAEDQSGNSGVQSPIGYTIEWWKRLG